MINKDFLSVVIVGHVDHGKSSLIGKLLADTNSLADGQLEYVKSVSESRGVNFEWAFLLDAFQAERDQGVTIDSTQVWFKTPKRNYVLIDSPGHEEFLKNMVTGASRADIAILVIDAEQGVQHQTKRHSYLLNILGVKQVIVAINKMDKVNFSIDKYIEVKDKISNYLKSINIKVNDILPISAKEGVGIADNCKPFFPTLKLKSYCLIDALDSIELSSDLSLKPLRFPVQDIYKFDDRRIIAGRIESGVISVDDEIIFSPSDKTAKVKSIETWKSKNLIKKCSAGESVGIIIDKDIFIERGEIISHSSNAPIESNIFKSKIFWLDSDRMEKNNTYLVKIGTAQAEANIQEIENIIDVNDLSQKNESYVEKNQISEVTIRLNKKLAFDESIIVPDTGRFALFSSGRLVAGGTISMRGYADQRGIDTKKATNITRVEHRVSVQERFFKNNHKSAIFWLTGLSGAGKSTIALELERRLFDKDYLVYLLDGDNIRSGLNSNLNFSPEDRSENIRRVSEVATLFARAGFVVISAFISPYLNDRLRARSAAGKIGFHEIFIKSDLETCEKRDPKGLYKKARSGEIKDFTGIDSPYDIPENPELVVDTMKNELKSCVDLLENYVINNIDYDKKLSK